MELDDTEIKKVQSDQEKKEFFFTVLQILSGVFTMLISYIISLFKENSLPTDEQFYRFPNLIHVIRIFNADLTLLLLHAKIMCVFIQIFTILYKLHNNLIMYNLLLQQEHFFDHVNVFFKKFHICAGNS